MKKTIISLTLALMMALSLFGCTQSKTPEDIASDYVIYMSEGKYNDALNLYSDEYKEKWTKEGVEEFWSELNAQNGAFVKIISAGSEQTEEGVLAAVSCDFENATVKIETMLDEKNKISKVESFVTIFSDSPEIPQNIEEAEAAVGAGTEWELGATLCYNTQTDKAMDAVIFVHGSGPNSRNEAVGSQALFRDLARYMAAEGVASLRYDKRTFTHAEKFVQEYGDSATVQQETIDDVLLAISTLKSQTEFKLGKIYLAGHSMGGMLLGEIANQTDDVSGYIFLAANARGLDELIVEQYEYLLGINQQVTKEQKDAYMDEVSSAAKKIAALNEDSEYRAEELMGVSKEYWLWFKDYDAAKSAAQISKPMLFLLGEKDYQVTMTDFNMYKDEIKERDNVTYITYPNLNHMFTESPGERAVPEDYNSMITVYPKVTRDILDFIGANK